MSTLLEYKCPACGGAIEFDSGLQKMKCPFCDTEFDVETLKELDDELQKEGPDDMSWETEAGSEWEDGETDGMAVYVCKSCGGEIIGDETMAATNCPFCDNPVVFAKQFSGDLRPDYVIPFKLDKKAATEGLKKHLSGKRLLPKVFKNENHIDEVKGVYVPFWLFDTDANAHIRYKATKTRMWSDSNYNYTETSHYSVIREGNLGFERVPVDGSSQMEDDLMESIEPYNFNDAVDFQTAYLAGYLANRYDVTADASITRANERVKQSTEKMFASTVTGFSTVIPESSSIRLSNGKANYALYPVWILNTTWNNKKYTFAMNGQTGKFVGNLPIDKGACLKWLAMLTPLFTAVAMAIFWLMWLL